MTVYGHNRGLAVVVVGDVLLLGNWVGTHFKNTNSSCDSAVKDKNTHLGGQMCGTVLWARGWEGCDYHSNGPHLLEGKCRKAEL